MGEITCYSDSDYADDTDSRQSITGFVVIYHGGPIVWKSTKQANVAQSTCEAEFIAASTACKDALWCQQLLTEINVNPRPFNLYVDNQGAIKIITNQQVHAKRKHIDVRYRFIRELVSDNKLVVNYVPSGQQLADILTKPLSREKFNQLREQLNIVNSL